MKNWSFKEFLRWFAIPVWASAVIIGMFALDDDFQGIWTSGMAWVFLLDVFGLGFAVAMYFWFPRD